MVPSRMYDSGINSYAPRDDSYAMRKPGTREKHHLAKPDALLQKKSLSGSSTASRALKSIVPSSDDVPIYDDAAEYFTLSKERSFMTFVSVGERSINVLEIQNDDTASDTHYYNFGMTVFLDTRDAEFVDANAHLIMTQIFRLYSMARPIPTKHVTWLQANFAQPSDLPFPTDTLIIVHWDSSHPFYVTTGGADNLPEWRGSDPEGLKLKYNDTEHTTTFMVPKNYDHSIYYYCWYHESMGVQQISLINPAALADDMQLTQNTPAVLLRDDGPVILRAKGVYAREQRFNDIEFIERIPVPVQPDNLDEIDEMIESVTESALVFTPDSLPILVDTSSCLDVADVLQGSRLPKRASVFMMDDNVTSEECGCVLSHAYFDIEFLRPQYTLGESAYMMYLTELQNNDNYEIVDDLWTMAMDELPKYGPYAQLAVFSCDNTAATSDTVLDAETDFSFVLKKDTVGAHITTMHCITAFCMVVIHTENCMNTKHVQLVSPQVIKSMMIPPQMMIHTLTASNLLTQAVEVGRTEMYDFNSLNGFPVLYAQRTTISFLCVNIDQTPCSIDRGLNVMRIMASSTELQFVQLNAFTANKSIVVTEMPYTSETEAGTLFTASQMYFTMIGISPTVQQYLQGSAKCPRNMISTGNTDTFHKEGVSVKIKCVFCGLNTYYSPKFVSPAPILNTTRTMYIRKFENTLLDHSHHENTDESGMGGDHPTPESSDMTYYRRLLETTTSYANGTNSSSDGAIQVTVPNIEPDNSNEEIDSPYNSIHDGTMNHGASAGTAAHDTPISYFLTDDIRSPVNSVDQMHGEECIVEIGTMLLLTLPDTNMTSICLHLICENEMLAVEIVDVNSISFYVSREFAGKAIFVQVMDATKSTNSSTHAVFFPRGVQQQGECIACPAGKFGGSIGASDIKSCRDSGVLADVADLDVLDHADEVPARRSLYADEIAPIDDEMSTQMDVASLSLLPYFEIDGQVVIVYEIDRSHQQDALSDFAIVAAVGNANSTHIMAHIIDVELSILRLYYAQSPTLANATFYVTRVNITERATLYAPTLFILTIEGQYELAQNMENVSDHTYPEPEVLPNSPEPETSPMAPEFETSPVAPEPEQTPVTPEFGNLPMEPEPETPPVAAALPSTTPKPESAFVVTMAVSLPFTLAEFDDSKQIEFKGTVANVAGVNINDVTIASITSVPTNAQRRLFAAALRIDMRINAASSNAASQMGATLSSPATLNAALVSAGLPSATVLVAPATIQTSANNLTNVLATPVVQRSIIENMRNPILIAAAIGAAAFVIVLVVVVNTMAPKHKNVGVFEHASHMPLTQIPQGAIMPEFAQMQHAPMSQMSQGRYYPIHDQSGEVTWHAQR